VVWHEGRPEAGRLAATADVGATPDSRQGTRLAKIL
jgi:hypothetical protein